MFFSPMYHRASLLINILIREPMATNCRSFLNIACLQCCGHHNARLDCWRSHLQSLRNICAQWQWLPIVQFFPLIYVWIKGGDVCSDLIMWASFTLCNKWHSDMMVSSPHFSLDRLLRGEGLLGKWLQSVQQLLFIYFEARYGLFRDIMVKKHIPAITSFIHFGSPCLSVYQLVLYLS